jgi:hypothetical protein
MDLVLQKCTIHRDREAVVRCPGCSGYFCRECVTEHEGKFLCSSCLQRGRPARRSTGGIGVRIMGAIAIMAGVSVAWFLFYLLGRLLILIPPNLHDIHSVLSGMARS